MAAAPTSPPIFFAPRPFFFAPKTLVFRGCAEVVFRIADEEMARDATGLVVSEESAEGSAEEERLRGDFERVLPLPFVPAFRKGEAVRLAPTGVPVREGGLLGRLIAGLSQEEKKSSDGSPAGVFVPSGEPSSVMSVIVTSSGKLKKH